jgi:DNA-binding response OmpR family regulator
MRILVVEDQHDAAQTLKTKLEAECYAVDVEHDGERAFYRARTNDYDLILLDNILPGKGGPEICSGLREYKMNTPILILSVQSDIQEKVKLLNCGADDYLAKPFSFTELSARVKALLRRPHIIEGKQLCVDDLILNRETYSALRDGRTIRLTPKEFSLLEYLIKNRGKVVSRRMILEHVWDDAADPFSNSIETHITNLRKKIDRDHKIKLIHTVHGQGYKIGG